MSEETRLAVAEAKIAAMQADMKQIKDDLRAIREKTDRASGVVSLVWICIPAAVAGLIGWLIPK